MREDAFAARGHGSLRDGGVGGTELDGGRSHPLPEWGSAAPGAKDCPHDALPANRNLALTRLVLVR